MYSRVIHWAKFRRRSLLRAFLLAGVATLTVVQVVALSPATVEESTDKPTAVDPDTFYPPQQTTLAPGIPQNRVPDYTVEGFNYVSTQNGVKSWKLIANQAYLYNAEKIVHCRAVKVFLYDTSGQITVVTSLEAKYRMDGRELELFGKVHSTLPDGYQIESEYLHHIPAERKLLVPTKYAVHGHSSDATPEQPKADDVLFNSQGMTYDFASGLVTLPEAVRVISLSPKREKTVIDSDEATILRNRKVAHFRMSPARPEKKRFVYITQPTLLTRGRSADLVYGEEAKKVEYLIVRDDVLIKEVGSHQALQYATAGRADFNADKDVVLLSEYPQVYQDHDTVTGDVILIHRDTDIVEVEHSNAYSEGGG